MTRDVVLIPTYMRPEFLQICLEHLAQTTTTATPKEFWICADRRPDDEHRHKIELGWQQDVLDAWRGALPLKLIQGDKHRFNGNSFNVLESYKKAYNMPDVRYVFLVEDDVMVAPDFFRWHEAVQQEDDFMCSVAYRCSRNVEAIAMNVVDPNAYFTSSRDYASIGVCWKREKLGPLLEHARPEYYVDQRRYVQSKFPINRFGSCFTEQDGICMRLLDTQKSKVAWSMVPFCWHVGFYGYHRPNGKRPDGYLEAKIDAIKGIIRNEQKLKFAAPDFGDIEPLPNEWPIFEKLYKVGHFE